MPFDVPYGASITADRAAQVVAAAVAEAKKSPRNWKLAISVVDPNGDLVYFYRMDQTQFASVGISQGKASTAARFRRPSQVFFNVMQNSGRRLLPARSTRHWWPLRAASPLVEGGKIIGAIGCSGATGDQDAVSLQGWRGYGQVIGRRKRSNQEAAAAAPRPVALSVAGVSDQRFLLAAEQDQDGTDDSEHEGDGLIEKVRLDHALPRPSPDMALDRRLQRYERALVNVFPRRADAAEIYGLVGDRLGAVVNQEDEAQGEQHSPTKRNTKRIMACPFLLYALEKYASSRYRLPRSPSPFNYSRFGQPVAGRPVPAPA